MNETVTAKGQRTSVERKNGADTQADTRNHGESQTQPGTTSRAGPAPPDSKSHALLCPPDSLGLLRRRVVLLCPLPLLPPGWPHTLTQAFPATLAATCPDSPPPRATLGPENRDLSVALRTASGALRSPPRPKPSRATTFPDIPHRSVKVRWWEVSVVSASPWQRPAPGSGRCVKQVLSATFSRKRSPPSESQPVELQRLHFPQKSEHLRAEPQWCTRPPG